MFTAAALAALWLRFKFYAYLAIGFAAWSLIFGAYAYTKGRQVERERCKIASLQFQLKQANTDLEIQHTTAIQVGNEVGRLNEVNKGLQEKVSRYESQVSVDPKKRSCVHDAGDVRSLRSITNRKAQPKRTNGL